MSLGLPGWNDGALKCWMQSPRATLARDTVDKGVGVWFVGGIFLEIVSQPFCGNNQQRRVVWLWNMVRKFYSDNGVTDRVSRLNLNTRNHLSSLGAAEARSLIPLAVELAEGLTINVEAMGHLHCCYQLLSSEHSAEVEAGALRMQPLPSTIFLYPSFEVTGSTLEKRSVCRRQSTSTSSSRPTCEPP